MAVSKREWPDRDPASVCPLNKNGKPDMCNYMPAAFVYYDEAIARGWTYWMEDWVCPTGHIAPRLVKNKAACVDCDRIKHGRPTIGRVGVPVARKRGRPPARGNVDPVKGIPQRSNEPSKNQKAFLEAYAELRDFDEAAKKAGLSPSTVESELSYSTVFRDACKVMEGRMGVHRAANYDENFEWTEEKEAFFIRTYVNTGLLEQAREAIRVTNFDFEEHLKYDPTFAAQVKEAEPLAIKLLKGRALRAVMEGNPQAMVKALNPSDFALPEDKAAGMTDEQLNDEIIRTLGLAKRESNAPAPADVESGGEVPAGSDDPEDVPEPEQESFQDIL